MEQNVKTVRTRRKAANLDEVLTILRANLPALQEHHRIASLGVFGSYVRGTQRRGSDIDLLVEFSEVPGLVAYIRTERALERLLRARVDLVMVRALKPEIAPTVLAEVVKA